MTVAGEAFEFESMDPPYVAEAEAEGHKRALASFRNALAVEKTHHDLYAGALEAVRAGEDLPAADIHVGGVCGETVVGEAPQKCPVCGAKHTAFEKVD